MRGEEIEWEGAIIAMLQPAGFGSARPVEVPWVVGCEGPKGQAVAHELGDGAFSLMPLAGFDRMVQLCFGTVLAAGEAPDSEHAMAAAGHAAAVILHGSYERGIALSPEWAAEIDAIPEATRHLAVHDRHLIELTDRDRRYVTGDLITAFTTTGTSAEVRAHVAASIDAGMTEIAYQPAGPDIPGELERFYAAVEGL